MSDFSISLVSYWNTKPFLYGLQEGGLHQSCQIDLDVPRAGGKKILNNLVDIALTPVVVLNQLSDATLLSDFCIGANGKVKTVCVFSNVPMENVTEIYLDDHSLTSIQLLRILLNEYWHLNPILTASKPGFIDQIDNTKAGLVIGDKSFHLSQRFKFTYDLAEIWKLLTGLPFVFAVWITRRKLPPTLISEFNNALRIGVENIPAVVALLPPLSVSKNELMHYLTYHIQYLLDEEKRKALNLFLTKVKTLDPLTLAH